MPPRRSGRNILASVGVMMISVVLSRRVSTRMLVQAFTTRSNGLAVQSFSQVKYNQVPRQFLSSQRVAQVDEDLDAALDNLLGDAMKDGQEKAKEAHIKDSKPLPPKLLETVSRYSYSLRSKFDFFSGCAASLVL